MGTEWGLRPFTIEQTTEDVTSIHRLAASRHPRATAVSPPAAGSGTRAAIRGKAGATVHDASRTSDQVGRAAGWDPPPGWLTAAEGEAPRRRARRRQVARSQGRRAPSPRHPGSKA
jgi:hypothetical protein